MTSKIACVPLLIVSVASCASDLLAQKELDEAHDKIAAYWSEKNPVTHDPDKVQRIARDQSELPCLVKPLIISGILSYLDTTQAASADELTIRIAKALAYPYMSIEKLADADGNVSVVKVPHQDAYAVAYDVATCAACTTNWLGIIRHVAGRWVVSDHLDNPTLNNAVKLSWVRSGDDQLLVLYGVHWGDAHNRLDVHVYSIGNKLMEVWSRLDLYEGTLLAEKDHIVLTSWTAPKLPCKEQRQVFEAGKHTFRLVETKLSEIK